MDSLITGRLPTAKEERDVAAHSLNILGSLAEARAAQLLAR